MAKEGKIVHVHLSPVGWDKRVTWQEEDAENRPNFRKENV